MSKRRAKHKPSEPRHIPDPAEAARRGVRPSEWGVNDEALRLKANADVDTQQGRDIEGKRRVRYDIFALLYYRPGSKLSTPAYDAVRRLQGDMAILHRTQGASDAIRATAPGSTGALAVGAPIPDEPTLQDLARFATAGFGRTRVAAGGDIDEVLAGMTPWCGRLIRELCEVSLAPPVEIVRAALVSPRDERNRAVAPPKTAPAPREKTPNWQAIVTKHTGERRHLAKYEHVRTAANDLAESYRRIDNEPREKVA